MAVQQKTFFINVPQDLKPPRNFWDQTKQKYVYKKSKYNDEGYRALHMTLAII